MAPNPPTHREVLKAVFPGGLARGRAQSSSPAPRAGYPGPVGYGVTWLGAPSEFVGKRGGGGLGLGVGRESVHQAGARCPVCHQGRPVKLSLVVVVSSWLEVLLLSYRG